MKRCTCQNKCLNFYVEKKIIYTSNLIINAFICQAAAGQAGPRWPDLSIDSLCIELSF